MHLIVLLAGAPQDSPEWSRKPYYKLDTDLSALEYLGVALNQPSQLRRLLMLF